MGRRLIGELIESKSLEETAKEISFADGILYPLYPYCKEAPLLAKGLSYPTEYTTLLVLEHCSQLRCNKRCGYKEHNSCKKIIECRTYPIFGLCRQTSQAHYCSNVHNCQGKYTQFGNVLCISSHKIILFTGNRCGLRHQNGKLPNPPPHHYIIDDVQENR